jgi:hypothetical protein
MKNRSALLVERGENGKLISHEGKTTIFQRLRKTLCGTFKT